MLEKSTPSASVSLDFQLHSLGWKSFQDLCLTILGHQLGQVVKRFAVSKDGGRDGAFVGKWRPTGGLELEGETVVQCKFTNRRDAHLTNSTFHEEIKKARILWNRRPRDNYVLMTNFNVSAEFEETTTRCFQKFGCNHFHVFGREWLTSSIQESPRLRTLVPRLYGLGDLSQILDERWYLQTRKLLEAEKENLRKFVPTKAYRQAVTVLNKHSVVLLLGEPAIGKSTIAAMLTIASGDAWRCRPMKLDSPSELRERWNPEDAKQLFWIDDAFGATQYDSGRAHEWNTILQWLDSILKSGSKLVLTSRDYIYARAKRDLKQSAFPLLADSQVIVKVADLTLEEREQILYNHVKMGNQPRKWRTDFKSVFDVVAGHEGFRPEIARRLGVGEFTRGLTITPQNMKHFVEHPEEFLRETIEGLSTDDRAALASIFIRGGALKSPVELSPAEMLIVTRLGSGLPGILDSLGTMRDTFVRYSVLDDDKWVFRHPSIGDAFAAIVAKNPELVDLYIFGASMGKLLTEISCGRVQLKGVKVVVPRSRFDLVIQRLHEYRASREGTFIDRWRRERQCYDFLGTRCSKSFLESYIAATPSFWEDLVAFGSYLSAMSEFPLISLLQREGLLSDETRRLVVERVKVLAVDTPDSDFLTVPQIKGFFRDSEISEIMDVVRLSFLPAIETAIDKWESNYTQSEDAEGYFAPLIEVVEAFSDYFKTDAEASMILSEAKGKLAKVISDLEPSEDNDEEEYGFDMGDENVPEFSMGGKRRIYDDIDV